VVTDGQDKLQSGSRIEPRNIAPGNYATPKAHHDDPPGTPVS